MAQSHHQQAVKFSLLFLFLFSFSLISAPALDSRNDYPIVKPDVFNFDQNVTVNVSVDSAEKWNTDDHGELDSASDLFHNWLGGLQGGTAGEYYHLTGTAYNYLTSNLNDFVTTSALTTALGNIHDQDLNTTNDVQFVNVTTQNVWANHINATTGNFTDLYVSNSTLYIGDVKVQSNNQTLNVSSDGPGITTVSSDFFEGDGSRLRNINLSSVNQTAVFEQDLTIQGNLIVNGTTAQFGNVNITGNLDMKENNISNADYITANYLVGDGSGITGLPDDYVNSTNSTVLSVSNGYLDIVMNFFTNLFYTKTEVDTSFVKTQGYSYVNGTLNITNIFADNLDVFNLTARQITAINITADTIDVINMTVQDLTASTIFARNFTVNGTPEGFCLSDGTGCENVSANIDGVGPWIIFDGVNVSFNDTHLQDLVEVRALSTSLLVTSSGGFAATAFPSLDFEIKQIIVTPTNLAAHYRFEIVGASSGDIIDKDRKLHTGVWSIEKNHAINEGLNVSFTSVSPDTTFNVTIKYIDNWN